MPYRVEHMQTLKIQDSKIPVSRTPPEATCIGQGNSDFPIFQFRIFRFSDFPVSHFPIFRFSRFPFSSFPFRSNRWQTAHEFDRSFENISQMDLDSVRSWGQFPIFQFPESQDSRLQFPGGQIPVSSFPKIGRAHVRTPVTEKSRMPSSA